MEEKSKRGYLNEDFRLFHVRDRKELQIAYHYHEFDKVLVFLSGNVTYVVEGKAYFLKPWDILLIPHNQIHRPIVDPAEIYERIILWIKPEYLRQHSVDGDNLRTCFEQAELSSFELLRPDSAMRPTLRKQLSTVEESSASEEFGHELMAGTMFLQFMVSLNRIALQDQGQECRESYRSDPKLEEIIGYINANLNSDLSLVAIARRFYISKSYLMHKFKEMTGCSAHRYIQQKRLMWAAEMIREGTPVLEAGQKSGFGDYSAFLRAFKKMFGVTPGDIGQENPTLRSVYGPGE